MYKDYFQVQTDSLYLEVCFRYLGLFRRISFIQVGEYADT